MGARLDRPHASPRTGPPRRDRQPIQSVELRNETERRSFSHPEARSSRATRWMAPARKGGRAPEDSYILITSELHIVSGQITYPCFKGARKSFSVDQMCLK